MKDFFKDLKEIADNAFAPALKREPETAFKCACGNSLKYQDEVEYSHNGEIEINFPCPTCGRRYYKKIDLSDFDIDDSEVESEGEDGCDLAHAQIENNL